MVDGNRSLPQVWASILRRSAASARKRLPLVFSYACYTAWFWALVLKPVFSNELRGASAPLFVLVFLALSGACLAFTVLFRMKRFTFSRPTWRAFVTTSMAAGTCCLVVFDATVASVGSPVEALILAFGLILMAVGTAGFRIEVDRAFGWVGARETLRLVGWGAICVFALLALDALLPPVASYALYVLLPIAASSLLHREVSQEVSYPPSRYYHVDTEQELPVPKQFIATSFVQGVANGVFYAMVIYGAASASQGTNGIASLTTWLFGAIASVAFIGAFGVNFNRLIYRIGFPLTAVSLMVLGAVSALAPAGSLALGIAAAFVDIVLWGLGAFLMKDRGLPAAWIASFPGAALFGGTAIGALVTHIALVCSPDGASVSIIAPLVTACLLLMASLALLSDKNVVHGWGTINPEPAEEPDELLDAALLFIIGEYGLTPREADVVRSFSEGLTRHDVAERNFISEETVKTHLRSIYRKLDVHSQKELVAFVTRTRKEMESNSGTKTQ